MSKSYDPKMHTAEHLLNQTMVRKFDCGRCFSAHINKKKSKCDYHFQRDLTEDEQRELENDVKRQIEADLPIFTEQIPKDEAQSLYNLERLPDKSVETIRIVRIGDYDACPCIGPHVTSTGMLGRFHISGTGFENGVLRIRFKLK